MKGAKLHHRLAIGVVRFYQYAISPLTGGSCRFYPSCSEYSVQAIREWGVMKGGWMALKRISKCHPWGGRGVDPVPKREEKEKAEADP